jgi:hypothetical protein
MDMITISLSSVEVLEALLLSKKLQNLEQNVLLLTL